MTIKSFEDLEVWRLSQVLAKEIYSLTSKFPQDEKYGLTSQLRRAAVSIGANIAEGFGRFHLKDSVKFLYNARGSLLEVKSHLLISKEIGYLSDSELEKFILEIRNLGVKLNNFINSLKTIE